MDVSLEYTIQFDISPSKYVACPNILEVSMEFSPEPIFQSFKETVPCELLFLKDLSNIRLVLVHELKSQLSAIKSLSPSLVHPMNILSARVTPVTFQFDKSKDTVDPNSEQPNSEQPSNIPSAEPLISKTLELKPLPVKDEQK